MRSIARFVVRTLPVTICLAALSIVVAAVSTPAGVPGAAIDGAFQTQTPKSADTAKPPENRFTPVVLWRDLDEPMEFSVLRDGRVLVIERKGALKLIDPVAKAAKLVATIPVNTKYTNAAGVQREAEEGLVGLTIDPNFEENHWIYMIYADPAVTKHVLARWELREDPNDSTKAPELVEDSKAVLLEWGTQREQCCHTGGGMTWDKNGNLYITVGNNTANSIGAQTDERPGRTAWDDQRGAANTNDLRGKILRIHPEPDGTYTIPKGNLFPPGTANTRPEIYIMGNRNPWRVSLDSRTGYVYWGEVGPDAQQDSEVGPRGYDELNQARGPGFFGWPYFVGDNQAFPYYDFANNKPLEPKDPKKPINTSVNNTGLRELPPAQPAFISYPYALSEKFPEVGTGARSATGGPIYHRADFPEAARPWPVYYEGKWIAADLSRGWIMAMSMDDSGNYKSMERLLPSYKPAEIIDIKFGPEGDLYVLEYGSQWFRKSDDAKLVRIEYNAGNRAPNVSITANTTGGKVPFQVAFSSAGTEDYDGDTLKYEWEIAPADGGPSRTFTTPNPTVRFDKKGVYAATLTVTDPHGANASKSLTIAAGNAAPEVAVNVTGNKTFFFPGKAVSYAVDVKDAEDGTLGGGQIPASGVALSIDYVPEGFQASSVALGDKPVDASTRFGVAQALMNGSDCKTCHNVASASNGPPFIAIAARYKMDKDALERLAPKVRAGGSGVWGEAVMPAHPAISMHEARTIVDYILHIDAKELSTLPPTGTYTPDIPEGDNRRGGLLIHAAYTDKGAEGLPPLTGERIVLLRSAEVSPATADVMGGGASARVEANGAAVGVIPKANSHIGFKKLDLKGITQVGVVAQAISREGFVGGTVEVHADSPTGPLLGQTDIRAAGTGPSAAAVIESGGPAAGAAPRGGRSTPAPGAPGAPSTMPAPAVPPGGPPGVPQPSQTVPAPGPVTPTGTTPAPGAGGAGRGSTRGLVQVDLKPMAGVHDVYFVFKNANARPIDPLMSVSRIIFTEGQ